MTNQEALKELKAIAANMHKGYGLHIVNGGDPDEDMEREIDIIETAIAALIKRIPKKPRTEDIGLDFPLRYCPVCDVRFMKFSVKYCGECGQAIDWEGE